MAALKPHAPFAQCALPDDRLQISKVEDLPFPPVLLGLPLDNELVVEYILVNHEEVILCHDDRVRWRIAATCSTEASAVFA